MEQASPLPWENPLQYRKNPTDSTGQEFQVSFQDQAMRDIFWNTVMHRELAFSLSLPTLGERCSRGGMLQLEESIHQWEGVLFYGLVKGTRKCYYSI